MARGVQFEHVPALELLPGAGWHVDVVIANTGGPSPEAVTRYAGEHKEPLELGQLGPESEAVLGRFWCTEIARHERRRLAFAVWSVLSQRLLS